MLFKASKIIAGKKNATTIVIMGDTADKALNTMIASVLTPTFPVIRTTHDGTIRDVAKTILTNMSSTVHVLIVDMNVYGKEDLIELGQLLRPAICVINPDEELGTIKSYRRAVQAFLNTMPKKSLIIGIEKKGIPFDYKTSQKRAVLIKEKNTDAKDVLYLQNLIMHKSYMTFDVFSGTNILARIKTSVLNVLELPFILSTIAVAQELSIPVSKILKSFESTKSRSRAFSGKEYPKEVFVIDNTNLHDIQAIFSYCKNVRGTIGKKIVVTDSVLSPLDSQNYFYTYGKRLGKVVTHIFSPDQSLVSKMRSGVLNSGGMCRVGYKKDLSKHLMTIVKKNDILIFDGPGVLSILRDFVKIWGKE